MAIQAPLSYYPINNYDPNDQCPICLDNLSNLNMGPVIAHTGEGFKHPTHENCIKGWFQKTRQKNCFLCKTPLILLL